MFHICGNKSSETLSNLPGITLQLSSKPGFKSASVWLQDVPFFPLYLESLIHCSSIHKPVFHSDKQETQSDIAQGFICDTFRKNTIYLHLSQGWELFSQNFNSPLWKDLHLISPSLDLQQPLVGVGHFYGYPCPSEVICPWPYVIIVQLVQAGTIQLPRHSFYYKPWFEL